MRIDEALDVGGPTFFRNEVFGNAPITMAGAPINTAQATDVASATTTNLDTATGNLVDVTGTTTITGITLLQGKTRIVRFTGALTLTHGASLVLPGAANIVTAAGDYAVFAGYASGVVRCVLYVRAAAAPSLPTTITAWAAYTPTLTGFGTAANVSFFWKQIGDHLLVKGTFQCGTSTATAAKFTIPSGKAIDFTKCPAGVANTAQAGVFFRSVTGALMSNDRAGISFADGSDTDEIFFGLAGNTGAGFVKVNGSSLAASGDYLTVDVNIPIS